ncbi:hypothetical protein M569_05522, partial [Genlisea aurea]
GEKVNIQELATNLATYKEQLQQVRELLADDPGNTEYLDMEKELSEVIALTEELLVAAKQSDGSSGHVSGNSSHLPSHASDDGAKFPVGTKVQAVWSEDGEWYDATVEAHTPNGYYVCYDGWGNREEV